jgi:hypothetical protein
MQLIETSKNNFSFNGGFTYQECCFDKIEHNGKVYMHESWSDVKTTVKEFKKDRRFKTVQFDFKLLDYSISIEDYDGFKLGFSTLNKMPVFSENHNSQLIQFAFNSGVLDKRIINVFSSNKDFYQYNINSRAEDWELILETLEVNIPFLNYGFNNMVYYTVKVETLFEADIKHIPRNIIELFNYYGIDLKSKNTFKEQLKFINSKILNT